MNLLVFRKSRNLMEALSNFKLIKLKLKARMRAMVRAGTQGQSVHERAGRVGRFAAGRRRS